MGVNAIISATGGSLGLFLGLSCYGVVWKLFEWLEWLAFDWLDGLRIKRANNKQFTLTIACLSKIKYVNKYTSMITQLYDVPSCVFIKPNKPKNHALRFM